MIDLGPPPFPPIEMRRAAPADEIDRLRRRVAELENHIEDLRYLRAPADAPDGWKLVPVEPTEDMLFSAEMSRVRGYRDLYSAMLSAAPTAPADAVAKDAGWQPIETAPKDGTSILGYGKRYFPRGWTGWSAETDKDHPNARGWHVHQTYYLGGNWQIGGLGFLPTHWMPLPAAPDAAMQAKESPA